METVAIARRARRRARRLSDRQVLWWSVLVTLLLRLPFIAIPFGLDEGGYAYVAQHWADGAGGIYGAQWVDRPPLLFVLYAVAAGLGGEVGVRLLGCVAAVVVIVACSMTASRLGGSLAMRWTALVAGVLASSPVLQSHAVNAEIPAIAFTATCVWLVVRGAQSQSGRAQLAHGVAAGLAGMAALLVKQSFLDGLVFAFATLVLLGVLDRRAGTPGASRAARLLLGGVLGIVLASAAFLTWTQVWGPGLHAMYDALYGFRVDARAAIDASPNTPNKRAVLLLAAAALTGMLALLAYVVLGMGRIVGGARGRHLADRPLVRATALGLAAMGAYGLVAIVLGGNWWRHYLIQLVPMLSVGAGLALATAPPRASSRIATESRRWMLVVAVTTLIVWMGTVAWSETKGLYTGQTATGDWLRAAARPGDSALVTWGNANVLERSGLETPYDMAWSLPIRVRDPQLREVSGLLWTPEAPTWVVEWMPFDTWGLDSTGQFRAAIRQRYVRVGTVCGKPVYQLRSALSGRGSLPAEPTRAGCGSDAPTVFGVKLR